jgi:very-short-patch-repair endonuclease
VALDHRALSWLRDHHATIATSATVDDALILRTDARRRMVEAGLLRRVVTGAYVFAATPEDELVRCTALCTSRPQVVIAGPTAARMWTMRRAPRDELVHVITPPGSNPCRAKWVRPYRTDTLRPHDVVSRPDGIRVTSPPRTVVDMGRYVEDLDLASLVEHTLERGMCTEITLRRLATRLVAPRRPWVRRLLEILDARAGGAPAASEWERCVREDLRRRGVHDLVAQHPVDLPGYGRARFDLAIPDLRWALEVDVHPSHRSLEGAARDNRRDRAAQAAGWAVCRVAELQLTADLDRTMADLVDAIAERRLVHREDERCAP